MAERYMKLQDKYKLRKMIKKPARVFQNFAALKQENYHNPPNAQPIINCFYSNWKFFLFVEGTLHFSCFSYFQRHMHFILEWNMIKQNESLKKRHDITTVILL